MKFTVSATNFGNAIESASKFVSAKPAMPVLSTVKILAWKGIGDDSSGLAITGFDLSHGIETVATGVEIYESGTICANAAQLLALVKQLSGQLVVEVVDDLITITTLSGTVEIKGMPADEYPDLFEDMGDAKTYTLDAKTLITAWKYCKVSASTDESKVILQGVNIRTDGGVLKIASTDGHRLTACEMGVEDVDIASITIPAKSIELLPNINNDTDSTDGLFAQINLSVHESSCVISNNTSKIITRLFEGKYPDYNMLIPTSFKRHLTVDRARLVDALNVMISVGNQKNVVTFDITETKLTVSTNRDGASGKMAVDCQFSSKFDDKLGGKFDGKDWAISFNIKYLLAQLKIISTKSVKFSMNGNLEPVIIEPIELENGIDLTCLVMPIQLRD